MFSSKNTSKKALEGSTSNQDTPSSSTKPSPALDRPLLQRLRLTVASDAIYLTEHVPDRVGQAISGAAEATTTAEFNPTAPIRSVDHVPKRRTLRITYGPPSPLGTGSDESEKATRRVELLPEGVQDEALQNARDYVVHGCIGLLNLYTGLHLIVVSAVADLGRIEDKTVYMIKKVVMVPLRREGACEILDKQGLGYDPFLTITRPPSSLAEELLSPPVTPTPPSETSHEDSHQPGTSTITPTPRVKFALFSGSKERNRQLRQDSIETPSTTKPTLAIVTASGDGHEASGNHEAHSPAASPPQSPRSPTSKFFSNFKLNFMNQDHEGQNSPSSSRDGSLLSSEAAPRPSISNDTPVQQTPVSTAESVKSRLSFDGFRPGRSVFGGGSKRTTKNADSRHTSTASSPARSIASEKSVEPEIHTSSTTIIVNERGNPSGTALSVSDEPLPAFPSREPTIASTKPPTSGLDAAEAFISNAARQLGNWSEEVVSGLLPLDSKTEAEEKAEQELERNQSWDRKIIREISSFFSSGFYFSYEINLLSSMQQRSQLTNDVALPLWKRVDRRFWWNEHLQGSFLEIGADEFILPIMQGFVEIEQCEIEGQAFEFVLISRRSRERSGLRYQRRGIDADGHAANFVETEQILRIVRDDSDHQVSFVQIRGSIPLFWSQSPYHLKPLPILERTPEENEAGFRRHFDDLLALYGRQMLVNLVEQHGREMIAGAAYAQYAEKLNDPQVRYIAFDFHEECRGMKYENIARLIKKLETNIQELGYCWLTSSLGTAMATSAELQQDQQRPPQLHTLYTQKGTIRTNCMDCLDRTNVVQSALARYILNQQLLRLGISSFPEHGLSVYEHFETIFNHVWANNGDAISRAYAGTSALKGDFTRTGKRNWQGMVNDATNSIARMYQNTFKDSFRQAAIDYMLGLTDVNVFKGLQTTAFGTTVVPAPVISAPPPTAIVLSPQQMSPKTEPLDPVSQEVVTSDSNISILSGTDGAPLFNHLSGENAGTTAPSYEQQHQVWAKVREAAIETSAEIVISPGEDTWRGWTLLCISNEVSSALPSASSGPASSNAGADIEMSQVGGKLWREASENSTSSSTMLSDVFYDEKVVLLTDRALYICTYDYEMEKVLEFWRLALEKLTSIDKGTFIISTATPQDVDPVENYGFSIIYRSNVQGETLRVNTGSVRNRRAMTGPLGASKLEPLDEHEEDHSSGTRHSTDGQSAEKQNHVEPSSKKSAKRLEEGDGGASFINTDEEAGLRSVRFKIVQHPTTKYLPFVQSSSLSSHAPMTIVAAAATVESPAPAKKPLRPTAQDCVELIVKDIVQARCELVRANSPPSSPTHDKQASPVVANSARQQRQHRRSPSEEYSFGVTTAMAVQVNLTVRDRVLQDEETAARLEAQLMKRSSNIFQKQQKKSPGTTSVTPKTNKDRERRGGGSKLLALLSPSSSKRNGNPSMRPAGDDGHRLQQSTKGMTEESNSKDGGSKTRLGFGPFRSNKGPLSMASLLGTNTGHLNDQNQDHPSSASNTTTASSSSPSSRAWFGRKKNRQAPVSMTIASVAESSPSSVSPGVDDLSENPK